jgi:tetratricopeptide (TPR) repeat protein
MELSAAAQDWPEVLRNARRFLAVNPLVPAPYRWLAQAAEATGDNETALHAFQALILLDPPNPADAHYQVARLLKGKDPAGARRHVLLALEEAPRHRKALRLLLDLQPRDAAPQPTKEGNP